MTIKNKTLGEYFKDNIFSFINLICVLLGLAFGYGQLSNRISTLEINGKSIAEKVDAQEKQGHPDHERRIFALEKRTDDLSALRQIVVSQSDQIRDLKDVVSKDHDSLMRMVTVIESRGAIR